jgi:thioredoxin-like negative regulator of GroEL
MASAAEAASERPTAKPRLVYFHSRVSGPSRRVEGFLAQVLQRRRNFERFELEHVAREDHPELHEKFEIAELPTLVVIENSHVSGRLESPSGCRDIERFLAPWLG